MPRASDHISEGPGSCWTWEGRHNKRGEPVYKHRRAYRVLYEELIGPVPDGCDLHHRCRRGPRCVNPFHLVPVSEAQNTWFAWAERKGQMSSKHLKVAKHFHDEMTERMRAPVRSNLS